MTDNPYEYSSSIFQTKDIYINRTKNIIINSSEIVMKMFKNILQNNNTDNINVNINV